MSLLLNPTTQKHLESIIKNTPQAVLITGNTGSGKETLAKHLAETVLEVDNVENYPYALHIRTVDNMSIGIESIRDVEHFLSLKVPINKPVNRAIILIAAEKLTLEAQNALLKTLEEPAPGSLIILTAKSEQSLLPTLRSRVQNLKVQRVNKTELRKQFTKIDEPTFNLYFDLSKGRIGQLTTLLNEDQDGLTKARDVARTILTSSVYERLRLVDDLSKNRQLCLNAIDLIKQMADVSLARGGKTQYRWQKTLSASYEASEAISANAQLKLVLTNLMLNL